MIQGEVNVAEVDASKNSGCATRFNVRAFPSLKFFHQVRSIAKDRRSSHYIYSVGSADS